jgi:alpha-tubulin suppressor-like RCC1 family protein
MPTEENPVFLPKSLGNAAFWGRNSSKIGFLSEENKIFNPLGVGIGTKFVQVSLSGDHAAAINSAGDLYQWGTGYSGKHAQEPECSLKGHSLRQIDTNTRLVAGLSSWGSVLLLDSNKQLQKSRSFPVAKEEISIWQRGLSMLFGQVPRTAPYRVPKFTQPLERGERFKKVCLGEHHVILLTNKGNVFTGALTNCGNLVGQLGIGATEETVQLKPLQAKSSFPTSSIHYDYQNDYLRERAVASQIYDEIMLEKVVFFDAKIKDIAAGSSHSVVLDEQGNLFSFGFNDKLQCGLGAFEPKNHVVSTPRKIPFSILSENSNKPLTPSAVFAKYANTFVQVEELPENGHFKQSKRHFFACGTGLEGQLGSATTSHVNGVLSLVRFLEPRKFYNEATKHEEFHNFSQVSIGKNHIGAVMDTSSIKMNPKAPNTLYLWGSNSDGQLGQNLKSCYLLEGFSKVACGEETTLVY